MAIINPEHPWDSYANKPLQETVRAAYRNIEQLYDLLNQKNPPVVPNLIDSNGSEEFIFMMAEI